MIVIETPLSISHYKKDTSQQNPASCGGAGYEFPSAWSTRPSSSMLINQSPVSFLSSSDEDSLERVPSYSSSEWSNNSSPLQSSSFTPIARPNTMTYVENRNQQQQISVEQQLRLQQQYLQQQNGLNEKSRKKLRIESVPNKFMASRNNDVNIVNQPGSYVTQSTPESTLTGFSRLYIHHTPQQESSRVTNEFRLSKNQHKRSRSEEGDREVHAFMSSPNHDSKSRKIAHRFKEIGNSNRKFTDDFRNFNGIDNARKAEKQRLLTILSVSRDTAALIIEEIWSQFHINPVAKIIPLKVFLQETLRRSRTSYSTLQTALFYLFRVKSQITSRAFQLPNGSREPSSRPMTPTPDSPASKRDNNDPATCGRRMFLAALIIASKYLQDRNYSNKAWSKISGLPVKEINQNEIVFLKLIDYNLFISEDIFKRWSSLLLTHIQAISGFSVKNADTFTNHREVERFREELQTLDPKTMECQRNSIAGFLATPDSSTPSTPRGSETEFAFNTKPLAGNDMRNVQTVIVTGNNDMRNVQKLGAQEMEIKMQTERNGTSVSRCSSSTVSPMMIYAKPNSQ
ncbi:11978_t:CDS:2 [Ambispora gerdemannii]|uniref:11978_t:CDS:1 n=1 Tax=Ambispora gerdemannii TaxID=144530 RepID=A0A9N9FF61_9GLOM|nr:11978_t:CDS:2 [Ambispora gerdemannii]